MGALTKAEMAERLHEELGLNKREAKELVELFFEEIRQALELNEQVKLSGFGNFDLRDKRQRPGRNPDVYKRQHQTKLDECQAFLLGLRYVGEYGVLHQSSLRPDP